MKNSSSEFSNLRTLFCVFSFLTAPCLAEMTFHVNSETGSDQNPGTDKRPFATLQRARDAIRNLKMTKGVEKGVAVEISGHFDVLKTPALVLEKEDGGASPQNPVIWRAGKDGCFITGACRLGEKDFSPVTGEALKRLKPDVKGKVFQCDLAKFGVEPLKPLPAKFNRWSEMELISSGKAMTIARYPNQGWLEITNVIDRGVAPCDRSKDEWEFGVRGGTFEYCGKEPERWDVKAGVYLFGFWCFDWASDTLRVAKIDTEKKAITMEGIHTYGLGKAWKTAQAKVRYFAYNMLEELDAPGEWFVDRATRTLYFYPTEDGFKDVSISIAKMPLVRINKASNVVLSGIDFKFSTGLAVDAKGCDNLTLDGLSVSWLSQDAVSVWGGRSNVVSNCRISQIGSTGLNIGGGDRKTLTRCDHVVRDCDIGYCGRLARISGPCLRFNGCGVTIEHNYFHDTPYLTVGYGGNEHLFQYNEIECSMMEAGDGGGMYTGRDWGSRGNVVRWNYLHHFGKDGVALRESQGRPSGCEALKKDVMVEGIYLDDCDSGETIYGNLFYKAGRAMFTGGGRDNSWRENLVIDCTAAVHFDTRGLQRAKPGSGLKNGWDLLAKVEACGYTNEPWASRYPQLIGVMDKEPLLPMGTEYISNVAVNCGYFYNSWGHATKFLQERAPNSANVSYNAVDQARELREYPQTNAELRAKLEVRNNVAFAAKATEDPVTFQDSKEFRMAFPAFPRIPVEQIGPKWRRVRLLPDDAIPCEGSYDGHLQGLATDGNALYWPFTKTIVKTDLEGKVLASTRQPPHQGDCCVKDGVLYVAVNLGRFNTETSAVSEVWAYDTGTLSLKNKWKVPELVHGAGGITCKGDRFYVVGGLPPTHTRNYVYEYTPDFKFVQRHVLETGYTVLGIQTAAMIRGEFIFGCYSNKQHPIQTLACPVDLKSFKRITERTDVGLVEINGTIFCARTRKVGKNLWMGFIVPSKAMNR